jgi:peptide deformylase
MDRTPIITVNDPCHLKALNQPAKIVTREDWGNIEYLLKRAAKEYKHRAVGIAATQVGWPARAFVFIYEHGITFFKNPMLVKHSEKTNIDEETCLSVPGKRFRVKRYSKITVRDDLNGKMVLRGFAARVWQHEFDHLEGKTLLDTGEEVK